MKVETMDNNEEFCLRPVRDADSQKGEGRLYVSNPTHALSNGLSTGSNPGAMTSSGNIVVNRNSSSPVPSGPLVPLGVHLQPDLNDGSHSADISARNNSRYGQCMNSSSLADAGSFGEQHSTPNLQDKLSSCSTDNVGFNNDIWGVQNGAQWGGMHASTPSAYTERISSPLGLGPVPVRNVPSTYLSDSVLGELSSNLTDEEALLSQLTGGNGGSSGVGGGFNMLQRNDSVQQHLLQVQQQQQMQHQAMLLQKLAAGRSQQVRMTPQQAQQQAQALALATSLLMGQGADTAAGVSSSGAANEPGSGSSALLSATSGGAGSASLYVKNLPPEADELLLYRTFSPLGALLSCKVHTDPSTGRCRGVGFVNFADQASAVRALQQLHGTRIADGRVMHITLQAPRAVRAAAAAANAVGVTRPTMAPGGNHSNQLTALLAAANSNVDSSAWSMGSGGGAMNSTQTMLALAGAKRPQAGTLNFPNSFSGMPGANINHGGFLSEIISPRTQGLDQPSAPQPSVGNLNNMSNMGLVFL